MPLPVVPGAGADPCHAQYQFFFLALISMRKLLNRILFHLYSRDRTEDPANGEPTQADKPAAFLSVSPSVMFELDRQLEEWRTCLPQGLEFLPYSEAQLAEVPEYDQTRSTDERLRGHLMARYFAAKSIIHRPYIYKTLHHGATASLSDADAVGARTAAGSALILFACELQLSFVLRSSYHYLLPPNWKIAEEARKAASGLIEDMSPTAFRDGEILKLLAC
ncbi:oleate-activated transcription factor 1 [Fusarium globosum]|uniref:Oleate-activated transcription factor 1 n=1 Tax=Fusarium globosum TaxID=78864 RepID=A0A8H5YW16_9HYPO|nr:oleate-activated transcription factor 1 [Fusarium globosum]